MRFTNPQQLLRDELHAFCISWQRCALLASLQRSMSCREISRALNRTLPGHKMAYPAILKMLHAMEQRCLITINRSIYPRSYTLTPFGQDLRKLLGQEIRQFLEVLGA